ncbi:hypothetical protein INT43_008997 [Umbelopsis isabellina]|uniref:SH3 domain-containing protein n=1 Tax=Mortierella isabellina TaxID=91625 RepID=A0A8H7PXS3_MORIS|nr:hypothetical protein INT43_008997 [Umbelopsis isabellina]
MPPHDISSTMLCSMTFADNFWGPEQKGVKTLLARMRHSKETCEDVRHMYEARALAAEEYSRKLLRIEKNRMAKDETGKIKETLAMAQENSQKEAQQYQQLAQTIRTQLSSPLAEFTTKQREARKLIQKSIQDAYNQRQLQARDKYNNECMRISALKQDKENQKAALSRAAASAKSLHAEYESSLSTAQDTVEVWNREWQACCDAWCLQKFQNLEEERINFLRESLSQFTYLQMTYTKAQLARWEGLIQLVNDWDGREEIDTYVTECGTGREIPDTMDYLVMYEQQEHEKSAAPSEDNDITPISPTLMRQHSVTMASPVKAAPAAPPTQVAAPLETNAQSINVSQNELPEITRDNHKSAEAQTTTREPSKEFASSSIKRDISKQSDIQDTNIQKDICPSPVTSNVLEHQPVKRTIEVAPEPTSQPTNPVRNVAKEPMYSSPTIHMVARQNSIQVISNGQTADSNSSSTGQQERGSLVRVSSTRPIKLDLNRRRGSLTRNNTVISTVSSIDSQGSAHTSLEKMLERFKNGEIGAGSQRVKGQSSDKDDRDSRRQRIGTLRSRHDNSRIALQNHTSWQSAPTPTTEESKYNNFKTYSTPSSPLATATAFEKPDISTSDPYQKITNLRYSPQEAEEDKYNEQLHDYTVQHKDEHDYEYSHNNTSTGDEDADHPTADLESQLDDMISLLNDGIDYQRDLMSRQSSPDSIPPAEPELLEETEVNQPGQAVHYDKAIMWVQALFDYQAQDEDELSFEAGDLIAVLSTFDDGWWHGELWDAERNQSIATGTIPSNFVEEVDVS